MSSVNDRQVGGRHYIQAAEENNTPQHWDRMWQLYREAWFVGNITKYVERYDKKDGLRDLEKADHYLEKLISLELLVYSNAGLVVSLRGEPDYSEINVIDLKLKVCALVTGYRRCGLQTITKLVTPDQAATFGLRDLHLARLMLKELIRRKTAEFDRHQ